MTDPDFTGTISLGQFLKTLLSKMAEEDSNCAELEMEIDGHLVEFSFEVKHIRKLNPSEAA